MKQKIKTVPLDIYKRGIQVFYGTKEQFIAYAKRMEFEVDEEEVKTLQEKTGGITLRLPLDAAVALFPNADEYFAIHELGHAAKHILRIVEVEDEEAEMYLLEHLCRKVLPWFRSISASSTDGSR